MNAPMHRITLNELDQCVSFRSAEPEDVPELVALYARFYEEAAYKDFLEWDQERATGTLYSEIRTGTRPHILALIDDRIVGFIAYFLDHTFSTRPCMVLQEFYIAPEHRLSAIGRALLALAIHEAEAADCGAFHAPICSGMDQMRSMFNLFSKAGFHQFGFVMRRGF